MELSPYLVFDGNCADAFNHYAGIFDGKVDFSHTYAAFGDKMPPETHDKVMYARVRLGDFTIIGSDEVRGDFKPPQGFFVQARFDDLERARRVFDALAEGGNIQMPFGKAPGNKGFGMLNDKFGTPWTVTVEE